MFTVRATNRAILPVLWRTPRQQCLDPHPDLGAALNALARLTHAKRRRGYQDRTS